MINILQHNFFTDATEAGAGEILENVLCNSLTVAVSGDAEGLDLEIYGKLGGWYKIGVVNLATLKTGDKITANGLYAVVGITGVEKIKAVINGIDSGAVTVIGRLM